MVEVRQIRKKIRYYFRKNQIKNQTDAAQRGGGGGVNPSIPPLDPPLDFKAFLSHFS